MIDLYDLAKTLRVMGHPDRLRILRELQKHPLYVDELAKELNLEQFCVSRHLNTLSRCGLVVCEKSRQLIAHEGMKNNRKCAAYELHWYSLTPETAQIAQELAQGYASTDAKKEHRATRRTTQHIA
jgi:DNA-binding transcriptional ArsR family regulator